MDSAKKDNTWRMAYKEGSEACRNYSRLTMRTRTLCQQILIVGIVGLGAAVASKGTLLGSGLVLVGGLALIVFTISLAFVDWHYQSAFSAIRNSLVVMEYEHELDGPWRAHLKARTHVKDHIASYLPFILVGIIGWLGVLAGLRQGSGLSWLFNWRFVIFDVGFPFLSFCFFLKLCWNAANRDKEMSEKESKFTEASHGRPGNEIVEQPISAGSVAQKQNNTS